MPRMKVYVYTPAPSPHLVGLLDALGRQEDLDLTVVYARQRFNERDWDCMPGRAPHRFLIAEGERPTWARLAARAHRAARRDAPDVAVVTSSYFDSATHELIRGFQKRGIPTVFLNEAPSKTAPRLVKLVRRILLRRIFRRISALIGVTEHTVDEYREAGYHGPATWAPYHRDLSPFLSLPLPRRIPERLRFVMLGALIERKDPALGLHAFARIADRAEFHFVGTGPLERSLHTHKERLGLHSLYFHGAVPYGDVTRVLRDMNVLVICSRNDGFGMAVIEGMAAGLPVLASDGTRAALQYVKHGQNGWLFPVGHVDALARQMHFLIDARQDWPSYSAAARRTVLEEYDADNDAARVAGFLRGIVERAVAP